MHIAFVTETYPPELNGAAMAVSRLVGGLLERGHRLQLVRPAPPAGSAAADARLLGELHTQGWPLPRYPGLRMGVPCPRRLYAQWTQSRPQLVHVATEGPLGWSALCAAQRLGIPVSSDFRTNFHRYGHHYGAGWLARPILGWLRWFHNRAQATMVPTAGLRRELQQQGFERLHVVGRGVDTKLFDPARRSAALRASWGADDDDLVLAYVGRLAPEKNLQAVCRAYEAVRVRQPRARLLLVGEGPMREALRAACPQAIFAGQRRGEDLAAHYASADVFLFASLTETFGNVVTEAMASGVPVVAHRHAAAAELIQPGLNGLLAASRDDDAFVAEVLALTASTHWRRAIGQAARATALRIGWDSVVGSFESVVRPLVNAACDSQRPRWALAGTDA